MRVTQSMLTQNSLRQLSTSYSKMGKLMEQLSTGKKISRPSDDPVVAMKGMYYRTNLTELEQYKRNLSESYSWMENSEAALDHVQSVMHRARELVVQGSNETYSSEDRQAMAKEIEQLKHDFVQVANTQVAGKYIFNGTAIDKPRITDANDPTSVSTENSPFEVEVSRGIKLQSNINTENVFNKDMMEIWNGLQSALETSDTDALKDLMGRFDNAADTVSAERSELGARYNRLEMVDNRIGYQEVVATRILSDNEDADIEKVITDLTSQESVHRASLGVGARVIQPSLLDFLR
ncbi:flagellar hook-associated protein FlgL [Sutcliffiella horikoshii]|uniref:Flagellar hook-associated protein FlgL n=1 Tax=Sutcliffiella horikoshii TaxID=79883 RepID=A0ABM6KNB9_9BACI|nr:flagellar hook-associated protein FlgL [Sutcliffiella horikoshii]ART78042.1 flagellar hook-associated protein FlgL [Sutcliffiella horikoshii]